MLDVVAYEGDAHVVNRLKLWRQALRTRVGVIPVEGDGAPRGLIEGGQPFLYPRTECEGDAGQECVDAVLGDRGGRGGEGDHGVQEVGPPYHLVLGYGAAG